MTDVLSGSIGIELEDRPVRPLRQRAPGGFRRGARSGGERQLRCVDMQGALNRSRAPRQTGLCTMCIDGDRSNRCYAHEVPQNRVSGSPTSSKGAPRRGYGRSAVMLTATTEIFRIAKRPRREPADGLTQAITPRPTATGLSRFGVGSRNGRRLLARRRSHSRTPCETHWNVPHSGNTRSISLRVSSWSAFNQQEEDMTALDWNT